MEGTLTYLHSSCYEMPPRGLTTKTLRRVAETAATGEHHHRGGTVDRARWADIAGASAPVGRRAAEPGLHAPAARLEKG
jgi:hypothetical protein